MVSSPSYKSTVIACYIGNFTQAIVVNLTPILFIPLREEFGLSYTQFGSLVLINFITQVLVDIAFSKAVDKYSFRPFTVVAHVLCVVGFLLFLGTPFLFPNHIFVGFLIATLIFSGSGGLLELLLSPIVDAIPTAEKDKAMAMLHSFYAWGQVVVVVITTLCLFFSVDWKLIVLGWILVPAVNIFLFSKVPLAKKLSDSQPMKIRHLLRTPIFFLAFFAIAAGGAAEVTMAQWTSSFMQQGLQLPKLVGDMLGMCGFAITLGIGRLIYGIFGSRLNLTRVLICGSFGAVICYTTVALSPWPWLSVCACVLTGICVSLLWPGTLVVASGKLPAAGASLFALLAAGGDIGASVGPWLTGVITDFSIVHFSSPWLSPEQLGLRIGILCAAAFPLCAMIFHILLKRKAGIHPHG